MGGLANSMASLSVVHVLDAIDAAATVNATSGWVAMDDFEGEVAAICNMGVMDGGSVTWTFKTAPENDGSGAVDLVPLGGNLATVAAADDSSSQIAVFPASSILGYVQAIGTIVTGGALVSVDFIGRKKYAT